MVNPLNLLRVQAPSDAKLEKSALSSFNTAMIIRQYRHRMSFWIFVLYVSLNLIGSAHSSLGDRLPDFRQCVSVSLACLCISSSLLQVGMCRRELQRTARSHP